MSKFIYILTIFMITLGSYSFADDESMCPEGMVYDGDAQMCVDMPPMETHEESSEG